MYFLRVRGSVLFPASSVGIIRSLLCASTLRVPSHSLSYSDPVICPSIIYPSIHPLPSFDLTQQFWLLSINNQNAFNKLSKHHQSPSSLPSQRSRTGIYYSFGEHFFQANTFTPSPKPPSSVPSILQLSSSLALPHPSIPTPSLPHP